MSAPRTELTLRPAVPADLTAIMAIEEVSFPTPWPASVIAADLRAPDRASYWVACLSDRVVAYLGGWRCAEEFHVGTIATAPDCRRRGLAEILLTAALLHLAHHSVSEVLLEYRASNEPAARLYRKLGFLPARLRPGYYADTGEDAVEVLLPNLHTRAIQQHLASLLSQVCEKHHYELLLPATELG